MLQLRSLNFSISQFYCSTMIEEIIHYLSCSIALISQRCLFPKLYVTSVVVVPDPPLTDQQTFVLVIVRDSKKGAVNTPWHGSNVVARIYLTITKQSLGISFGIQEGDGFGNISA